MCMGRISKKMKPQDLHGSCPLLWHWVLVQIPTVSVVGPSPSLPAIDLQSGNGKKTYQIVQYMM